MIIQHLKKVIAFILLCLVSLLAQAQTVTKAATAAKIDGQTLQIQSDETHWITCKIWQGPTGPCIIAGKDTIQIAGTQAKKETMTAAKLINLRFEAGKPDQISKNGIAYKLYIDNKYFATYNPDP